MRRKSGLETWELFTLACDLRPEEGGEVKSSWEKDMVSCPHFRGGERERTHRQDEKVEKQREGDVKEGKGEDSFFS